MNRKSTEEIRAASAAQEETDRPIYCMPPVRAVELVEKNHGLAIKVTETFPSTVLDVVKIAPEMAVEIAGRNVNQVLEIVQVLAENGENEVIRGIAQDMPAFAERIFTVEMSIVEHDHEKAKEIATYFPELTRPIVEVAPEKAMEIAEMDESQVLNIASALGKIGRIDSVIKMLKAFPKFAARIVDVDQKYGLDPVQAFQEIDDKSARIEIAKTHTSLIERFVDVCPDFAGTASLLISPGKRRGTV